MPMYIYIYNTRFALHIIGASLSEPHIDEKYMRDSYIYIYMGFTMFTSIHVSDVIVITSSEIVG